MEIKVLGPGCMNCRKLHQVVVDTVAENNIAADIQKVEDIAEIVKAGVLATPALMVNGKVVSSGRVLTKQQVLDFLSKV